MPQDNHSFTLYSVQVRDLVWHITTMEGDRVTYESASFDVDKDGNVTVYVEGKEPLRL